MNILTEGVHVRFEDTEMANRFIGTLRLYGYPEGAASPLAWRTSVVVIDPGFAEDDVVSRAIADYEGEIQ